MDLVIGNITDGVYVTDSSAKLIFVNQFFADLIGKPRVFLLGEPLDAVFPVQEMKNPQQEFLGDTNMRSLANEEDTGIYQLITGDRVSIFKISCRFIETLDQKVYIAKDITHEHEQSLLKTNFVNIASHQLRTPMSAIMTYSHMLHDGFGGDLNESQKKLASTVISSSERMIMLINDILLITRIENGDAELIAKDSTLGEVFRSLESELRPKIKSLNIDFNQKFDAKIDKADCNKFVMHEIISNLLTNAIQYTPANGRISLTAKIKNSKAIIIIKDSGIGIPADEIPKIYNQFSRAHNAFELFNEGTGLGLYVVKMLIGHINGDISCQSTVNIGTTFKVSVPVA